MPKESNESLDSHNWPEILEALEAELEGAQPLAAGFISNDRQLWSVPSPSTPLPAHLEPLARQILERQQKMLKQLRANLVQTRRHIDLLQRDASRGVTDGPRFFDQEA